MVCGGFPTRPHPGWGGTGNADEYVDMTLIMENQLMENLIIEKHMDILLETASKDCWQCCSKMMPSSKRVSGQLDISPSYSLAEIPRRFPAFRVCVCTWSPLINMIHQEDSGDCSQ